jgi:hypothetical protein
MIKTFKQFLIQETSLGDLEDSTTKTFPDTKKRQQAVNKVYTNNLIFKAAKPSGTLQIDSVVRGETGNYQINIFVDGVTFADEKQSDNIEILGNDNVRYYIEPISQTKNDAKVRCKCQDFRWTFSLWNYDDDSLYGKPYPPYIKKTDRKPRNPDHSPGMCKHIMSVIQQLKRRGIVQ